MDGQSWYTPANAILMLVTVAVFDTPCKGPPRRRGTTPRIALQTDKKWPGNGVRLRVGFIDKPLPDQDLRQKIVNNMNAWSEFCNVRFTLVDDPIGAEVRISFSGKVLGESHPGYWSELGIDVLGVDYPKPTMMLTRVNERPESFFGSLVQHETGHTLGFVHEHLRPEIVNWIDPAKAIKYYGGPPDSWSEEKVRSNVLQPLKTDGLTATAEPDIHSIMCYSISTSILKEGAPPIPGGDTFTEHDKRHAAFVYRTPQVHSTYVSAHQRTTAIAASGSTCYELLSNGQIHRTEWNAKGDEATIGPSSMENEQGITDYKFLASDHGLLLYYKQAGFTIIMEGRLDYGMSIQDGLEWIEIGKIPTIEQIEVHGSKTYYRTQDGWIGQYTYKPGDWEKLDENEANLWIAATNKHLYKSTKNGGRNEIYRLSRGNGWDKIDDSTDILQLVTTNRNVYKHHKNGQIYVYSGVDEHWNLVYEAPNVAEPAVIQAQDDRLFRIVGGKDVWVNDNNHTSGWKSLNLDADWTSFVYTEGYIYEFAKSKGTVKRYIGLC